mgnify:CR=1 FL=1
MLSNIKNKACTSERIMELIWVIMMKSLILISTIMGLVL